MVQTAKQFVTHIVALIKYSLKRARTFKTKSADHMKTIRIYGKPRKKKTLNKKLPGQWLKV